MVRFGVFVIAAYSSSRSETNYTLALNPPPPDTFVSDIRYTPPPPPGKTLNQRPNSCNTFLVLNCPGGTHFCPEETHIISIQSTTNSNLESAYSRPSRGERITISGYHLTSRSVVTTSHTPYYQWAPLYIYSAEADVFGLPVGCTIGHDPSYPS